MTIDPENTVASKLYENPRGRWHQWLVRFAALVAVLIAIVLPPLSLEQQFWVILGPVAIFGLSHGGADPFILQQLVPKRPRALPLAMGVYFLASLAFLLLVWFVPTIALLVFLILSIWHFGFTDAAYLSAPRNTLLMWLCGSLPVLGPILGHPKQTGELLAWLVSHEKDTVYALLTVAGPSLAALWLVGFGVLFFRHHRHLSARVPLELILVGAALVLLPPLLAFAFYFCLIHSVRHFLSITEYRLGQAEIKQVLGVLARKTAPATLGALTMALFVWVAIVMWSPTSNFLAEAVRVMFWGLAALTVPHGIVVKLWWDSFTPAHSDQQPHPANGAPARR